jgi:Bacteriophage Sf6, terminase small subunit-like
VSNKQFRDSNTGQAPTTDKEFRRCAAPSHIIKEDLEHTDHFQANQSEIHLPLQPDEKKGKYIRHSKELEDEILWRISCGESLKKICRDPHMPDRHAVMNWRMNRPGFGEKLDQARVAQAMGWADEILDIADDGSNDFVAKVGKNKEVLALLPDKENIQRSRLRVDTRKWLLTKILPRMYGDKITQTIEGGERPVTVEGSGSSDFSELREKLDKIERVTETGPVVLEGESKKVE